MSYTIIPPPNELKDYVRHFWTRSWNNGIYYATAATTIEITFGIRTTNNHKPEFGFSSLKGQSQHFGQYPPSGSFELFGVSLYPYALPFLFNFSVTDVEEGLINLDLFLQYEGEMLNEKMVYATTASQRIKILGEYLKEKLRKERDHNSSIIRAIQKIHTHHGNLNIQELAGDCCLSNKQFERRFKAFAGFSPKLYCMIMRFENALLGINTEKNLTKAAYQYGYFDQSHFIRDFRRFSGFAPKAYSILTQT